MGKFNKFKKKLKKVGLKAKLTYRISKQAIGEIRKAKSVDSLLAKHIKFGKCKLCKRETEIIKTVRKCTACSTKGKKWEKKFRKLAVKGVCLTCQAVGLVSKKEDLCFNCYVREVLIK